MAKLVWVTGASSGLGYALALEMARRGYRLALTARSEEKLAELKAEIESDTSGSEVYLAAGDVSDAPRMAAIVGEMEQHGGIDIAVLNAGIYIPVDGTAPPLDAIHKTFDVNLKGTANCVVPLIEVMKPRRRGQITMVASVTGYVGLPTSAAYGATKAGMINFAEGLRFDTDRLGITVQVVNPGFVDTPATADNPFEMPFLLQVDDAARRMADGIESKRFEITFPKRFTYQLKLLRLLPYDVSHWILSRTTGWKDKPLEGGKSSDG
ncbi:MAG: SDR family NAD(P)-dependent oxidoreductase [Pseudomonadota bacterium]